MSIYILGYKGKSFVSKTIQWQTRSEYSHVSIEIDGVNYEAWHIGGVTRNKDFCVNHTPGTPVDVLHILEQYFSRTKLIAFLEAQLGKKYDFRGVFRFLTRRKHPADEKWFCSELVASAYERAGIPLSRIRPSYLSPRDIMGISPKIATFIEERITW